MQDESDDEEEYDDFEKPAISRLSSHSSRTGVSMPTNSGLFDESSSDFSTQARKVHPQHSENTEVQAAAAENPLLQKQKDEIRTLCSSSIRKSNPFKKTTESTDAKKDPQEIERGFSFIEAWKKPTEKTAEPDFNPKHSEGNVRKRKRDSKASEKMDGSLAPTKLPDRKKQATLFDMHGTQRGISVSRGPAKSNPPSPAVDSESEHNSSTINCEPIGDLENAVDDERYTVSNGTTTSTKRKGNTGDEEDNENVNFFSSLTCSPDKETGNPTYPHLED